MSVATKLEYLNDTKQLLKENINNLGGNLTNEPFRQYASVLEDIYESLPKISGIGASLSLSPTMVGKIKLNEIQGDTLQNTNYPLPSGYTRYTSVTDTNGTVYTATSTQIPAKRNSDNVFGLYNISNKTFTTEV
jgi:hypothetical protein